MYCVELLKDIQAWEEFINFNNRSTLYHLLAWRNVINSTFGYKTFYIVVKQDGIVKGVLPLVLMRSKIFGSFLISMPFLNYGGICADSDDVASLLLQEAVSIARRERVAYIELRQKDEISCNLPVKKSKITMILELKPNLEDIWKGLDAKVRNQIRKAQKERLRLEVGSLEQVDNFYRVFCLNMRDLGTPVYSRLFFRNIMHMLGEKAKIMTILLDNKVLASGLTIANKDTVEIPWASSMREYNKLCANTMLYWEIIKYASLGGYKYFDFGRCSLNSGTYQFKKQWGASPKQLYWYYWLANGKQLPELNPSNPKYKLLISIWQRLPLLITNYCGPFIAKSIP